MRFLKFIIILFVAIILQNFYLYPSDKLNKNNEKSSLFFYVPSSEEVNILLNLYELLVKWDSNNENLSDKIISEYYNKFINQELFQGLLFESFLLQTQNKKIQKNILNLIEKNNLNDLFSKTIYRKYNSTKKIINHNNKNEIKYNYNNEYYDENINLFFMYETLTFNNKLGFVIFDNDWLQIDIDNKIKNKDTFILMYGGGTNSLTVYFNEYSNISEKEFYNVEINKRQKFNKYKNWKIEEISIEGHLLRASADKIYIGFGNGPDVIEGIENAEFSIYLYNNKLNKGYSLSYFMNISEMNNNYEIRYRIWNHLLMQLTLTFIYNP